MRRNVITLVVLSEEPIPERMDIADVAREWESGDYVLYSTDMTSEIVGPERMAKLLYEAGSDPDFFQIGEAASS